MNETMTNEAIIKRAQLAAGMILDRLAEMTDEDGHETTIRRAYHQLTATLGAMHGTDAAGAQEVIEELMESDG
jgi:hypothetical protein